MYDLGKIRRILSDKFDRFGFTAHQYPNAIGMWSNEQESLFWLALNSDPKFNWMEIGSFCGGSATLMCLARKELNGGPKVISVDVNFEGWGGAFNRNLYRIGQFQDISVKIECNSRFIREYYNDPLSLLFIDGWHSFARVLGDFEQLEPLIQKNGFVAFHDTSPQPYKDGQLDYFYDRAISNYDNWIKKEEELYNKEDLSDYHRSEQDQDFMIDEAIAYILNNYDYELVDIPVLDGSTHFDRVREYKHGTTSPHHGLVAIQKKY